MEPVAIAIIDRFSLEHSKQMRKAAGHSGRVGIYFIIFFLHLFILILRKYSTPVASNATRVKLSSRREAAFDAVGEEGLEPSRPCSQ